MCLSLFQHNIKDFVNSYITGEKILGSSLTEACQEVFIQHATVKDHFWSNP